MAYRANGTVVIAPVVRTTSGLGLEVEPECLGENPDQESVAGALAHALAQSDRVIPHPAQDEWKGFFQPFLKAAGVRSFKAFMATAQSVYVDQQDGALIVTPNRNMGPTDGFEPIPSEALKLPDLPSVARAVLELLPRL